MSDPQTKADWEDARAAWGGCRKNAGRKKTGRKPFLVRMKPRTMKALRRAAKGQSVGEYLDARYAP